MSAELNKATADRLTSQIETCSCDNCQEAISKKIFTELQIAQARGNAVAHVQTKGIVECAEGLLTALNCGNVDSGSPLHLQLRKVVTEYREALCGSDNVLTDKQTQGTICSDSGTAP